MTIGRNPAIRTTVMARRQHRTHSATFNTHGDVADLRGDKTVAELPETFLVHPNQLISWNEQLLERRSEFFDAMADGHPAHGTQKIVAKISGYPCKMIFRKCTNQRGIADRNKITNR